MYRRCCAIVAQSTREATQEPACCCCFSTLPFSRFSFLSRRAAATGVRCRQRSHGAILVHAASPWPRYSADCRFLRVPIAADGRDGPIANLCTHPVRDGFACVGPFMDGIETPCRLWEARPAGREER